MKNHGIIPTSYCRTFRTRISLCIALPCYEGLLRIKCFDVKRRRRNKEEIYLGLRGRDNTNAVLGSQSFFLQGIVLILTALHMYRSSYFMSQTFSFRRSTFIPLEVLILAQKMIYYVMEIHLYLGFLT